MAEYQAFLQYEAPFLLAKTSSFGTFQYLMALTLQEHDNASATNTTTTPRIRKRTRDCSRDFLARKKLKMTIQDLFPALSQDVFLHVCAFLDWQDLRSCRSLNRLWKHLIQGATRNKLLGLDQQRLSLSTTPMATVTIDLSCWPSKNQERESLIDRAIDYCDPGDGKVKVGGCFQTRQDAKDFLMKEQGWWIGQENGLKGSTTRNAREGRFAKITYKSDMGREWALSTASSLFQFACGNPYSFEPHHDYRQFTTCKEAVWALLTASNVEIFTEYEYRKIWCRTERWGAESVFFLKTENGQPASIRVEAARDRKAGLPEDDDEDL